MPGSSCAHGTRRRRRRRRRRRAKVLPSAPPAMSWWPRTDRNGFDQIQSPNVMPMPGHATRYYYGECMQRTEEGRQHDDAPPGSGALNSRVPVRFAGGRVVVRRRANRRRRRFDRIYWRLLLRSMHAPTRARARRGSRPSSARRRRPGPGHCSSSIVRVAPARR